jgi:hypothetical protein
MATLDTDCAGVVAEVDAAISIIANIGTKLIVPTSKGGRLNAYRCVVCTTAVCTDVVLMWSAPLRSVCTVLLPTT